MHHAQAAPLRIARAAVLVGSASILAWTLLRPWRVTLLDVDPGGTARAASLHALELLIAGPTAPFEAPDPLLLRLAIAMLSLTVLLLLGAGIAEIARRGRARALAVASLASAGTALLLVLLAPIAVARAQSEVWRGDYWASHQGPYVQSPTQADPARFKEMIFRQGVLRASGLSPKDALSASYYIGDLYWSPETAPIATVRRALVEVVLPAILMALVFATGLSWARARALCLLVLATQMLLPWRVSALRFGRAGDLHDILVSSFWYPLHPYPIEQLLVTLVPLAALAAFALGRRREADRAAEEGASAAGLPELGLSVVALAALIALLLDPSLPAQPTWLGTLRRSLFMAEPSFYLALVAGGALLALIAREALRRLWAAPRAPAVARSTP